MEYIYSAMLLHAAGKKISEDGITKILDAAGIKSDPTKTKALVASLEGVNIDEAISSAVFAPSAAGGASAAEPAPGGEDKKKKKEEKKEKEKEEEKGATEEAAAEGLSALFG